jgi:hypothetical protein
MRAATLLACAALATACHRAPRAQVHANADSLAFAAIAPENPGDSILKAPRVVDTPTVLVFWLPAGDTLNPEDAADAYNEMSQTTSEVADSLRRFHIQLLPTNAETVYVALPNRQRRTILLTGLDYPFGYVLLEPGSAEQILTGTYEVDDLLDEIHSYFDLPEDSTATKKPKIST